MSEYTYYEFIAIDQPLSPEAMAHLRACSSRASITASSFSDHYNWGGLKGDPVDWVRRWFDAYLQVDAGGWRQFALRLPLAAFDDAQLKGYAPVDTLRVERTRHHVCLWFELHKGEDYERYAEDDGHGWMVRLLPLREELLRGDLRALYLGWLAAASAGDVKRSMLEPSLPPGLGELSPPQQALLEFLEVDIDLLAAAAEASEPMPSAELVSEEVEAWLSALPPERLRSWAYALVRGSASRAAGEAQRLFGAWRRQQRTPTPAAKSRSLAQLFEAAKGHRERRLAHEAQLKAKREAEQRARREAYLRSLMADPAPRWQEADRLASKGTASAYDAAARIVVELSQAYALAGESLGFNARMQRFALLHARRPAMLRRLEQAGLRRPQS